MVSGDHTHETDHNPRYSSAALVIDVVRLLRGRGVIVPDAYDQAGALLRAAADLLSHLGVEPDSRPAPPAAVPSPVLIAAATLMRAAGIEPNAVAAWPQVVAQ